MTERRLDIGPFRKALASLKKVMRMDPNDDVVRDAAIQRFEYTFELAWKMMERHIQWVRSERGGAPMVRKELFREAARHALITDPERWFDHQEARNTTSHAYDENAARMVFAAIPLFTTDAEHLLIPFHTTKPPEDAPLFFRRTIRGGRCVAGVTGRPPR